MEESVQQCSRCCCVLANHVIDNDISAVYCDACAAHGRGPPLVSRFRNTSHDCVEGAPLSSSRDTLSLDDDDDDDDDAQSHSLKDNAPPNDILRFPESMSVASVGSSNGSSFVSDVVATSSDQLQDSDCVSTDRGLSSVTRLMELVEMLAQDEDIAVHCGNAAAAADDDDDDDAVCCQSEIGSKDRIVIKHTAHSSSDCDTVLSVLSSDEADSNGDQVAVPDTDQQTLDDSPSDMFHDTVSPGHSHQTTLNSVRGSQCLGSAYFCSYKMWMHHRILL